MNAILAVPVIIAFFATFLSLPKWIKKAKRIGLMWEDMNKNKKELIAGSGGIAVILGFVLSLLVYIAVKTFYFNDSLNVVEILALISSVLILAGIGLVDDLFGWQHGGLSTRVRIILCLFSAIPLVVINAGHAMIDFPFIGAVNMGLIYPLVLVPLAILATSTTFNILAGYNGLEAGQGIIIMAALALVTYFTGSSWLALICICLMASLVAFWIFNKYPAKVFPGDVLTYPVGGMIGIVAIFGNIERIAVFFFIPYLIEIVLKLRGKLKMHSFGKPNKDSSLEMPYPKIYGLEHVAIWFLKKTRGKAYEREVTYVLYAFQILIILAGLLIFRNSIF